MDRSLWIRNLSKFSCPSWQCPCCSKGTIVLVTKSLVYEETAKSSRSHKDPEFDPDWIHYLFTAWAKCNHASCQQKFAIAGEGGVSPEYTSDEGDWEYEDYFVPKYCFPMPHIIALPQKCPDEMRNSLTAAFNLFWSNRSSCAGQLRVSLEALMNHLGVPKKKKAKNGRYSELTLHGRIDAFAIKEPRVGSQLMALKWLGNTGSHEGDVSRTDLLDAFEILEHTLTEILDKRSERVARLAQKLLKKHARKK